MIEEWKPVVGWPEYDVSDLGRVRCRSSCNRYKGVRVLTPKVRPTGYTHMRLYDRGRTESRYVHRMVADAFIGPCPKGMEVNHIDADPRNNAVTNLEYVTHTQNMRHSIQQGRRSPKKLTEDDVRLIRRGVGTAQELAPVFGVDPTTIAQVRRRVTWKQVA